MYNDFFGLLVIITIVIALVFFLLAKKKEGKNWVSAAYFTIVLLGGTALYYFALDYNNDEKIIFSQYFMILSSLSFSIVSFVGNFNSQSVLSELAKESQIFQTAIIIHFIAAVFLTFLAIVKLFGEKVKNEIHVWVISLFNKYIVIGYEGQAKIFLKNLSRKQRRSTIVIIQPDQLNIKWELISKGYAVVTVKEEKEGETDSNFYYKAFHDALKKAGAMRHFFKSRIISMSVQDETNLLIAKIMTDYIIYNVNPQKINNRYDLTLKQEKIIAKMNLNVRIMYSFLERAEHYSYMENTFGKLRFFNPYKIRAHKFWWENPITKLIPYNWIDTDKARLRSNPDSENGKYKISTIFVGFGSTNKSILKTSIINNQLLNIDYNALVITQDAIKHEKMFRNSAIGLFDEKDKKGNIIKRGAEIKPNPNGKVYLENPQEQNNIRFEEADALTPELYDHIINEIEGKPALDGKPAIQQCDYITIIIALGNDKLGIETALELRQKLYEANLLLGINDNIEYQRVRIFVKIYEKTILADDKLLNYDSDEFKCNIVPCGADEEVMTDEYIINEKLDILAKNISSRYEGGMETITAANEWNTCKQAKRESNRYAAMAIKVKLNLLGLDLMESNKKPISNLNNLYNEKYGTYKAFDLRTKRKILEKSIENLKESKNNTISNEISELIIDDVIDLAERDNKDFADTSRNNLAKLEHQRWNAFHLANDWTKLAIERIGAGRYGRQNEFAKQHACITTFQGLVTLRDIQKNAEKSEKEKAGKTQYIEADSLLRADTLRHDFMTMDFLIDLSSENLKKMRDAEGDPNKKYTSILTGSGYYIGELKKQE